MSRRSQITVFFILGMVILIIFGLIWWAVSQADRAPGPKSTVDQQAALKMVQNHVEACLETSLQEGLVLLGRQGGFIYQDQPGDVISWSIPSAAYQGDGVAYQIYDLLKDGHKPRADYIEEPPLYPCYSVLPWEGGESFVGEQCHKNYHHNLPLYFYGSLEEPVNGVQPSLCTGTTKVLDYMCRCTDGDNCVYSIEEQLRSYISYSTRECVQRTVIEGYNVTSGKVTTEVIFAKSDVQAELDFEVSVEDVRGQSVSKRYSFSTKQPLRFSFIYDLVFSSKGLLYRDISNVSFDMVDDGKVLIERFEKTYAYTYPSLTIEKKDIRKGTDIITVKDEADGYVFQFARENRYPVMDYLTYKPCRRGSVQYDICVDEGDAILLEPKAFDPDEDILSYTYTGWKGTEFQATATPLMHGGTTYKTGQEDSGTHTVRITVQDPEGLSDWQDVNIFVRDA
ncbi:hypothetical protein GF351_01205 [Candidatus Woesearchaeota archaeon]|nr:hypothetical protein [Candidatus Woesearchaeota archaeon]